MVRWDPPEPTGARAAPGRPVARRVRRRPAPLHRPGDPHALLRQGADRPCLGYVLHPGRAPARPMLGPCSTSGLTGVAVGPPPRGVCRTTGVGATTALDDRCDRRPV